jgi:lactate 2-monooxygenase
MTAAGSGSDREGRDSVAPGQPSFGAFHDQLVEQAAAGLGPWLPSAFEELEASAERLLSPRARAYLFGAAGRGDTLRANLAAFERWRLIPRAPVNVSNRDHSTRLLGTPMCAPVLIAPIGA